MKSTHTEGRQMETRFTPGPWTYENTSQHTYAWIVLTKDFDEDANRGTVLCRVSDGLPEADARLIAAAPDGYDFASRFEAAVGFLVAGLPANHAVAKDLLGLRDVARAYLAKARGEKGGGQ